MLIPSVFTAVFVLIPKRHHVLATTLAGVAALLAPTLGPLLGGWLTETQSWHWIFLINILPGLLVTLTVLQTLKSEPAELSVLRRLDVPTLLLFAVFLAGLQWLLHEAPGHHWRGVFVFGLAALCLACCALGIYRALVGGASLRPSQALSQSRIHAGLRIELCAGFRPLRIGLSAFAVSGRGARPHAAWRSAKILLVFGAAQLLTAPFAAWAETRIDGRLLTRAGLCSVRPGADRQRLHQPDQRLRCPVLAAGDARLGGDVLSSARDAACAGYIGRRRRWRRRAACSI